MNGTSTNARAVVAQGEPRFYASGGCLPWALSFAAGGDLLLCQNQYPAGKPAGTHADPGAIVVFRVGSDGGLTPTGGAFHAPHLMTVTALQGLKG